MARGRGPWSEEACWKLSISRQKCQYLTPTVSSFDFSYKWHFQNRKILRKWHNPEWMSVTKGEPDLSKSTHGLSTGGARRGSNTEGSWSSKVCVSQDSVWYIQAQCGTYRLSVVRTGSVWYVQAQCGTYRLSVVRTGSVWYVQAQCGTYRLSVVRTGSAWGRANNPTYLAPSLDE